MNQKVKRPSPRFGFSRLLMTVPMEVTARVDGFSRWRLGDRCAVGDEDLSWGSCVILGPEFANLTDRLRLAQEMAQKELQPDEQLLVLPPFLSPDDSDTDRFDLPPNSDHFQFVALRTESDEEYKVRLQGYADRETKKRMEKAKTLEERIDAAEDYVAKLKAQKAKLGDP